MIRTLIVLILVLSGSAILAQNPISNYRIESLQAGYGFLTCGPTFANQKDFRKLYPYSDLAKVNLEGFEASNFGHYNWKGAFSISATVAQKDWQERNRTLRVSFELGFQRTSLTALHSRYTKMESGYYRSFFNEEGDQIDVDTTHFQSLEYHQYSNLSTLIWGIRLNTDSRKRWSVYSGINFLTGLQYGRGQLEQYDFRTTEYYNQYGHQIGDTEYDRNVSRAESYRPLPQFMWGVSLPVSIQLRLARETPFLNRLRLIFEKDFALINYRIKGYGNYSKDLRITTLQLKFDL